jgi:hypothetical protein
MRGPCTGLLDFFASMGAKFLPQTVQRVAFSLNREPQVGQTFVVEVVDSVVII